MCNLSGLAKYFNSVNFANAMGCVSDGSTDTTTALQSAMDSLGAGDSLLLDGQYRVSSLVQKTGVSLMSVGGTWGVGSAAYGYQGGAVIFSNTAGVPVLDIRDSAGSHFKHRNIRINGNIGSETCVKFGSVNNGAGLERVFLDGSGCPTGILFSAPCLGPFFMTECYTTNFSDANITNNGCALLHIDKGINDVGGNCFVRQQTDGGHLFIRGTYLEWQSGVKDVVILNNHQKAPTRVKIEVVQTAVSPRSIIHQIGNTLAAPIDVDYAGMAPEFLYLDDAAPLRNIPWQSEFAYGVTAHKGSVNL